MQRHFPHFWAEALQYLTFQNSNRSISPVSHGHYNVMNFYLELFQRTVFDVCVLEIELYPIKFGNVIKVKNIRFEAWSLCMHRYMMYAV